MDPLVFVLVAGAAVLHVTWNVLLKTAGDPLRAAAVGMATAAALICPVALVIWLIVRPKPDSPWVQKKRREATNESDEPTVV